MTLNEWSRPSRARGLKRSALNAEAARAWSRPSRARGLKRRKLHALREPVRVAPLAGAWIETR